MSEEQKQEAAELGKRAARQSKHAAKNGLRAVQHGAEAVVEATAEEIHDTAQKAEATADDVRRAVRTIDRRVAKYTILEGTKGAVAVAVAIYATRFAFGQYGAVVGYRRGTSAAKKDAGL